MHRLFLCLALSASMPACAKDKPQPKDGQELTERYDAAVQRLFSRFYDRGYIVSRTKDGAAEHTGEAALWAGVAMGSLPCDKAKRILEDLFVHFRERDGEIRRYEPLGPQYAGRELNFDGETGLVYGFSVFLKNCPNDTGSLFEAWALHQRAIRRNGGELFPGSGEKMPEQFSFTTNALNTRLGINAYVDPTEQDTMEQAAVGWALALHVKKDACYRVHLSFLHIQAAEALGYPMSESGRWGFCTATRGMDIPTVDFFCGRSEILGYIDAFKENEWEYRHQRCGAPWELPDGNGLETPGLDLIVAIKAGFDL